MINLSSCLYLYQLICGITKVSSGETESHIPLYSTTDNIIREVRYSLTGYLVLGQMAFNIHSVPIGTNHIPSKDLVAMLIQFSSNNKHCIYLATNWLTVTAAKASRLEDPI